MTTDPKPLPDSRTGRRSWPRHVLALLLVLLLMEALHGGLSGWMAWYASAETNPALAEGWAWWHGRVTLPDRLLDTAQDPETGVIYNVYPPLLSIVGFLLQTPLGGRADPPQIPPILPLLIFGLAPPIVAYMVFRRQIAPIRVPPNDPNPVIPNEAKDPTAPPSRIPFWAAVLTLAWMGGTATTVCISRGRHGEIYLLNHILSQVGLLLFAGELLGRRRVWPMMLALLIAAWSRQLTFFYGGAALAVAGGVPISRWTRGLSAWMNRNRRRPPSSSAGASSDPSLGNHAPRGPGLVGVTIGLALIAGGLLSANWLRLGSPLRSGYEWIYTNRENSELGRSVRAHGVFSPAFIARNAWYMNAALPSISWREGRSGDEAEASRDRPESQEDRDAPPRRLWLGSRLRIRSTDDGVSVWLTTPLAALILLGAPWWCRDRARQGLMLCSALVIAGLLCYHATGASQPGHYRFALDFLPVWFVAAAGWLTTGWRRWATAGCVLWSVGYFAVLLA